MLWLVVGILSHSFTLQFVEDESQIRSTDKHFQHCALLEQEDLTSLDHQHYSTTYGVNRRALLDGLRYFNVASGALIPDIMHDILEGALPLELKCMLKVRVLLIFSCSSS